MCMLCSQEVEHLASFVCTEADIALKLPIEKQSAKLLDNYRVCVDFQNDSQVHVWFPHLIADMCICICQALHERLVSVIPLQQTH